MLLMFRLPLCQLGVSLLVLMPLIQLREASNSCVRVM